MRWIRTLASLAAFLVFLFSSTSAFPVPKFGTDPPSVRRALRGGKIEEALGYYESLAREREKKALTGGTSKEDWKAISEAYEAASKAAQYAGRLQKSIIYGHKTLEAAERTNHVRLRFWALLKLITAYRLIGQLEESRKFVDKGFEFFSMLPPSKRGSWEAALKNERGKNLTLRKKYDEAIELLTESLSLREAYLSRLYSAKGQKESQIKTHRGLFILTLIDLGRAYHEVGRLEQAMEQYQRALSSIKEWGLKTNFDALLYSSMGKLYGQLKKYPQALQILKKALALDERRRRVSQAATTSQKIADILHDTGKHSEAIPYYGRAVRIIESTRSLLESDYRQSYFGEEVGAYVGMVGALLEVGKPAEAFSYNERARSRLFLDLLGSKVELSKAKGDLREEGRALNERISVIKAKLARKMRKVGLRKELKEAERAYDAFLANVRKKDKEQASLMTVESLTLKKVQQLLDPGTTLIEYFVTDSKVHAWIVEKNKARYEGVKLTREKLTHLVKNFRRSITSLEEVEKFNQSSAEMYETLIRPVLTHVSGKQLIIVPHDVLHYLPFQALISSSGRYLIEDYSIHYLSSASLMKFTS